MVLFVDPTRLLWLAAASLALLALSCERERPGPMEGAGRGVLPNPEIRPSADAGPGGQGGAGVEAKGGGQSGSNRHGEAAISEVEPNDARKSAQPLGALVNGGTLRVQGELSSRKDQDWFFIESAGSGEASRVVRAELTPESGDVRLELWTQDGRKAAARWVDNAGAGQPERLTNFTIKGPFHLAVRAGKTAKGKTELGGWALEVSLYERPADEEQEPNGAVARATALVLEQSIRGWLNTPDDTDWYVVQGNSGQESSAFMVEVSDLPPKASVTVGATDGSLVENLPPHAAIGPFAHPPSGAKLELFVQAHGEVDVRTPYRLLLREATSAESQGKLLEPNDGPSRAIPLGLDVPTQGSIDWPGDRDWYKVGDSCPGVLRLEATPRGAAESIALALAAPKGQLHISPSLRPGATAIIPNAPCVGTSASFAVLSPAMSWGQRLEFEVVASWRDPAGEEREPNDTWQAADSRLKLAPGQSAKGWVGWAKDVDLYEVDLSSESAGVILTAKLVAPADLPVTLRLLDMAAKPPRETGASKEVPAGQERALTHFFGPGQYALEVRGAFEDGVSSQPYRLSLGR